MVLLTTPCVAFGGYGLVSVSGFGLPKPHSDAWSPRPLFGVSFRRPSRLNDLAGKRLEILREVVPGPKGFSPSQPPLSQWL